MNSKLFALDIGTRSVVGIILEQQENQFHVIDILVKEHKERAMVDGQIHNVLYVAELIKEIKLTLEEVHGPLQQVSVAAAGRSLKTEVAEVTIDIGNRPIFTEEDISRLELQAVQQAQTQLVAKNSSQQDQHYYCVGYSVLYYRLDGDDIGSLVDQQGKQASIEVIATFLPRVVVESLLAALNRAELEMEALTLEPIAAINVLIPPSMRRLNVALVDIGAGTSDIAITDKGTIIAYGMVPTAGDEVTEALSDQYLLDFPVAEKIKKQLLQKDEIIVEDILGFEQSYLANEIIQAINPTTEQLAKTIATEILHLNNAVAPKAIMLVGGGSLTPNITSYIAAALSLPENRVAVRDIDAIQNLTRDPAIKKTPELVTPIGIAIAAKKSPIQYMSVTVNQQVVRLFELKDMTVADAFLAANIRAKQLYGKPGLGISITFNGRDLLIPGQHGQAAEILLNGQACSTKSQIKNGDVITIKPGIDGTSPSVTLREIVEELNTLTFSVNGEEHSVIPTILCNNSAVSLDYIVQDRDQISLSTIKTVEDALIACNQESLANQLQPFQITLNGQLHVLPQFTSSISINGQSAKPLDAIQAGDKIIIEPSLNQSVQTIADEMNLLLEEQIIVTFQGEPITLKRQVRIITKNNRELEPQDPINNGDYLISNVIDANPWVYQDIFRFTSWTLPENYQGNFTILRNGEPCNFDQPIFGGDQLLIDLQEQQIKQ